MLTVPNSEDKILNILKISRDTQGLGRWATDSQVCQQMSGGDPRTGTFTKRGLPWEISPVTVV